MTKMCVTTWPYFRKLGILYELKIIAYPSI